MVHKSKTRGIHSDIFGYVEGVIPKVTELLKNRESVVGRQIAEKTKIRLYARRGYPGSYDVRGSWRLASGMARLRLSLGGGPSE